MITYIRNIKIPGARGLQGPEGPEGPEGPQGPVGPEGPQGKGGTPVVMRVTGTMIQWQLQGDLTWNNLIDITDVFDAITVIENKLIIEKELPVAITTVDWSLANSFFMGLGGDRTLSFLNATNGQTIRVTVSQDSTGGHTLHWPAGIKWQGGTEPHVTLTADHTDVFSFFQVDGVIYGSVLQDFA